MNYVITDEVLNLLTIIHLLGQIRLLARGQDFFFFTRPGASPLSDEACYQEYSLSTKSLRLLPALSTLFPSVNEHQDLRSWQRSRSIISAR